MNAVRSYRTFSPLPTFALAGLGGRYIFCATFLQVTLTGRYPAHCPAEFGLSSPHVHRRERARRSSGRLRRNVKEPGLAVRFLTDAVLLELLVQVAAWRIDFLRGLGNVPSALTEFPDEKRALTRFLERT